MKQILLSAIFFAFTSLYAQTLPMIDGKVVYEQTDSVPDMSQSELYAKAKSWIINSYPSREKNIISESKESGKIVSYGMTPFNFTVGMNKLAVNGKCYYKIQVECKDNKTLITFFDITAKTDYNKSRPIEGWDHSTAGIDQAPKEQAANVKKSVNDLMISNLGSFKNSMTTHSGQSF